jgi:outer membrane receptor protein involved in Fe transport
MKRFNSILMLLATIVFCHFSINAQATAGSIRGTVVDSSGGVIVNASVKVKNEATGVEKELTTNGEGAFSLAQLTPGTYSVTVESKGFKRAVTNGLPVNAGGVTPADITLETGNVSETVIITTNSEQVLQTEQSQVSQTIGTRSIQDLPSNGAGGGLDTLALTIPGVIPNRQSGTNTNGTGLSVNGNRGRSNNFQLDGADNNDLSVGGPALFVDFQDSVQEYQVITNNFDARYGRNQGAIVNIVGKGGTNDFHGSAFWHHQDAKVLNSLDNIDRRSGFTENDQNLYNVYGGTVGGPVFLPGFNEGGPFVFNGKDRAFFFFGYQGIRNPAKSTASSTSLGLFRTDFSRLVATFPGNPIMTTIANYSPWALPGATLNTDVAGSPSNALINTNPASGCPRAIATGATPPVGCTGYVSILNPSTGAPFLIGGPYDVLNFGTPTVPLLFQAAQYQRTQDTSFTEDYYVLRFDVKATSRDNITFRLLKQSSASKNALATPTSGFNGDIPAGSKNFGGNWTHQFSNAWVNDFRFNFQRIAVEFGGGCGATLGNGCIPGPAQIGEALANIAFPVALGLTKTTLAMPTIGPATNLPQGRIGKVYQYIDNLTWLNGKHTFNFGYEYKYLNTISPFLPNYNGSFSFNSAERIRNNAPSAVSITDGDPTLAFKEKDHYFYVQDDFKIRSNLTLNLGVRYEYTGQPINVLNDIGVARESNPATRFYLASVPFADRVVPRVPADKNNWAPRFGFAYTPHFWKGLFGEDATVFRGGYSIAYDASFYNILLNVMNAAPFAASLVIPTASLPTVGSPSPLPNNPIGSNVRSTASASGVLPRGQLDPRYLAQTQVAPDFKSPYAEQWSFGMQRLLGKKHIVEVRYVGTHGIGLFQNINGNFFTGPLVNGFNINRVGTTRTNVTSAVCAANPTTCVAFPSFASQLPAGTTAQVCVNDPATVPDESACNNRQFRTGGVTRRDNSSSSMYHGLQARYGGRFLNDSLSFNASYSWSKTMDDSGEIFTFADISSPNAQNPFCINRCEYSLSNLDRPQSFSASFILDVPFFKSQKGFVGHLLGGWQLNSVYLLASGARFTPNNGVAGAYGLGNTYLTAGDRAFAGNPNAPRGSVAISQIDAFMLFGSPLTNQTGFYSMTSVNNGTPTAVSLSDVRYIINGPGSAKIFGTPFGTAARNTEVGPIFNQLNFSVFKNINVWESVKIQLRGEAFNVLNHPNPGYGVASGGTLPITTLTNAGIANSDFNNFDDIRYANRVIQVGLRVVF